MRVLVACMVGDVIALLNTAIVLLEAAIASTLAVLLSVVRFDVLVAGTSPHAMIVLSLRNAKLNVLPAATARTLLCAVYGTSA
jgi:hypothetical protein